MRIDNKNVAKDRLSEDTGRSLSSDCLVSSDASRLATLRGTGYDDNIRLLCEALALSRDSSAAFVAELLDTGWRVVGAYRAAAHRDVTLPVPAQIDVDRDIEIRLSTGSHQDATEEEVFGHFAPVSHNGKLIGVIGLINVVSNGPATLCERLAIFRFGELAGRRIIERSLFHLHAREALALFEGNLEGIRVSSVDQL